jgi:hypothetical protein
MSLFCYTCQSNKCTCIAESDNEDEVYREAEFIDIEEEFRRKKAEYEARKAAWVNEKRKVAYHRRLQKYKSELDSKPWDDINHAAWSRYLERSKHLGYLGRSKPEHY